MLSTRGMGAAWGRESSESAPAEEDDAPASSPTATSSMTSKEPGDSSSPGGQQRLHFTHTQNSSQPIVEFKQKRQQKLFPLI